MVRENDLPCSDCGAELVERSVESQDLSASPSIDGSTQVAECPECGARYFPERFLSKLSIDRRWIEGGD